MGGRVMVAMSGGVDSATAAALLVEQGFQVFGVTMRLWSGETSGGRACCRTEDVSDAFAVCRYLGIPHYVMDMEPHFNRYVVEPFLQEYSRGRTPNPCLECNRHLKFRLLLGKALALGADYLATGHYARTFKDGSFHLLKGRDPEKDQSYFLFPLGQAELKHVLFPVGGLTKEEVRQLARERGLPVAEKAESQDICFAPGDYRSFLTRNLIPVPGEVMDLEGRVVGSHPGIAFFTIGQRRGLALSGGGPRYVVAIDAHRNRLIVGEEKDLYRTRFLATEVSWVSGEPPPGPVAVRVRYRSREVPAVLFPGDGGWVVELAQPQRAIAPGQAAVFYRGEELLGGGSIAQVGDEAHRC